MYYYLLFLSNDISIIAKHPHIIPIIDCVDILLSLVIYRVAKYSNIICSETNTLKYAGFGHVFII